MGAILIPEYLDFHSAQEQNSRNLFLFRNIPNERALTHTFCSKVLRFKWPINLCFQKISRIMYILCTPRTMYWSIYRLTLDRCIGRYVDRYSTDVSVDISTNTRPIYRPRYVGRYVGRYVDRHIGR